MDQTDLNDPSTWTCIESHYNQTWMGQFFPPVADDFWETTAINGKLAWVSFDFGVSTPLKDLYLWNIRYGGGVAGVASYNLYYADTPGVALPAEPNKGSWSNTGTSPQGDYDFANAGAWTLFNTAGLMTLGKSEDKVEDISGVVARYVAVEIMDNHGDDYRGGRTGFNEVAFSLGTAPPPAGTVILVR